MSTAKAVVLTPVLIVDGVDVSPVFTGYNLEAMCTVLEAKVSGDTAVTRDPGLKDFKFTADIYHDSTFTLILDHFWDLIGTKVVCTLKPANATVSATNPLFTFTAVVGNLPLSGNVDEFMKFSWNLAVDGEVVKTTS